MMKKQITKLAVSPSIGCEDRENTDEPVPVIGNWRRKLERFLITTVCVTGCFLSASQSQGETETGGCVEAVLDEGQTVRLCMEAQTITDSLRKARWRARFDDADGSRIDLELSSWLDGRFTAGIGVDQQGDFGILGGTPPRELEGESFTGTSIEEAFALAFLDFHEDGGGLPGVTFDAFVEGANTCVELSVVDDDMDGIASAVEEGAPNGGDGNNDGVQDGDQLNVTSLPNAEDGQYISIVSPSGTTLQNVSSAANPAPDNSIPPVPVAETPIGFLAFEVAVTSGASSTVEIILPPGTAVNQYWKYGVEPSDMTPHWYLFDFDGTTGAQFFPDRVVLHFVDGLRGDDDLLANGIIVDPGLALQAACEDSIDADYQTLTISVEAFEVNVFTNAYSETNSAYFQQNGVYVYVEALDGILDGENTSSCVFQIYVYDDTIDEVFCVDLDQWPTDGPDNLPGVNIEVLGASSALQALEQCIEGLSLALGQPLSFSAEGFVGAPDFQTWNTSFFEGVDGVTRSSFDSCLTLTCALPTTVIIDGCDTNVPNYGGIISSLIDGCAAEAANHGDFVSCVAALTNSLKKDGVLSGKEKWAIQKCAAQADLP